MMVGETHMYTQTKAFKSSAFVSVHEVMEKLSTQLEVFKPSMPGVQLASQPFEAQITPSRPELIQLIAVDANHLLQQVDYE